MRPKLDKALEMLRFHIPITFPIEVKRDFASLEGLSREEKESKIRQLAKSGKTVHAVQMARELYGFGDAEALRFVNELKKHDGGG